MSVDFVLDMALKSAGRGISAFFNGHAWTPEFLEPYVVDLDIIKQWQHGEREVLAGELLVRFQRLAMKAGFYAGGTDIHAYEASYIVWIVGFIERKLKAVEKGE